MSRRKTDFRAVKVRRDAAIARTELKAPVSPKPTPADLALIAKAVSEAVSRAARQAGDEAE